MIRVTLCQIPVGAGELTLRQKLSIKKTGADIVCLPEYLLIPPGSTDYSEYARLYEQKVDYLAKLSNDLGTTLIGGTVVSRSGGKMYNTSFVFSNGYRIGSYRKMHPTVNEQKRGISPGSDLSTWKTGGARIGILICADALHPECFEKLADHDTDIIFVPTVSPFRPDDTIEDKIARDEGIFVDGAKRASAYVVKTCGTGSIFGNPLQGRSLVAAPWELLWNVGPDYEQAEVVYSYDLDIDRLRNHRRKNMIRRLVGETADTLL